MDNLQSRIEQVISEAKGIMKIFESVFADSNRKVSFKQVKEIEKTVEKFKKQNLPVPEELKTLKLALLSKYENHKEMMALYNEYEQNLRNLASSIIIKKNISSRNKETIIRRSAYRKPANYEKPLGSKGNTNLEDYLIPVIKIMWHGNSHIEAFRKIAEKLDVRYSTVSAQCTRALGLSTDQFVNSVKSKEIVNIIKKKYFESKALIDAELK